MSGRVIVQALAACFLAGVLGCSGGESIDIPQVDISQLSPEDQVIAYAADGNLSALQPLIESNSDLLKVRGARGGTPLHFAASNGHKDVVEFLLQKGANPLAQDDYDFTAAQIAAQEGYDGIASLIDSAAAQPPAR